MLVCLFFFLLAGLCKHYQSGIYEKKMRKMDPGPTWIQLNFDSDPDHHLDTKKYQRSRFSSLLIIELFYKNQTFPGGLMRSTSALVIVYIVIVFIYSVFLSLRAHFCHCGLAGNTLV